MATQARPQADAVDAQLVLRAQTGDEAAFTELFRRHAHPAWRLALAVGGSPAIAERAVAEGYTLALVRLHRRTTNLAVPFRLQVARASGEVAAAAARRSDAPAEAAPNDSAEVFLCLPDRWRAVLWLTLVEGGSPAQVAPIVDLSADATASLAARARAGLRASQTHAGQTEPSPGEHDNDDLDDLEDVRSQLKALVVPMPAALRVRALQRWQAWQQSMVKDTRHGLASVLTFSPRVERAVATAAAGVFVAGIAAAVTWSAKSALDAPKLTAPIAGAKTTKTVELNSTPASFIDLTPFRGTRAGGTRLSSATGFAPAAGDIARGDQTGSQSSTSSTTTTSTSAPPAQGSETPAATGNPAPGASAGADVGGTSVAVIVGPGGVGATVGDITVGTTPPAPPADGAEVVVDPGNGIPPIVVTIPIL